MNLSEYILMHLDREAIKKRRIQEEQPNLTKANIKIRYLARVIYLLHG